MTEIPNYKKFWLFGHWDLEFLFIDVRINNGMAD